VARLPSTGGGVRPPAIATPTMLERFEREAKATASLRHPNIVSVYEVGRTDDVSYYTMDYIEGRPFSKVIAADRPVPVKAVRLLAKIARLAHQRTDHQFEIQDVLRGGALDNLREGGADIVPRHV